MLAFDGRRVLELVASVDDIFENGHLELKQLLSSVALDKQRVSIESLLNEMRK